MLTRTLKMAFWVMYDHLGKLILANLVWAVAIAVPGTVAVTAVLFGDAPTRWWVGVPAGILAFGVVLPVMSAGIAQMVKVLIDRKDGSLSDMLDGVRLYWRRAAAIGLTYVLAIACLTTSVWFYAAKLQNVAGYLISAVALWCLVFAGMAGLLVMPALVQKRERAFATLKLAALLVLDNPLLVIGLAVQVLTVTVLAVPVWPMFFVCYGAIVLVLGSSAYELMARKYAAADALSERSPGTVPLDDENDDYLNRGVRDVFFPWKG